MNLHIVPQVDLGGGTMTVTLPEPTRNCGPIVRETPCSECDADLMLQRSPAYQRGEDCTDECGYREQFEDTIALAYLLAEQVGHRIRHATPEARREQIQRAEDFIADEFYEFGVKLNVERFRQVAGAAS